MPYQNTEFEYWFTFDVLLFNYKYEYTAKKNWFDPVTHQETNHHLIIMSNYEKGFYRGLKEEGLFEEFCEENKKNAPKLLEVGEEIQLRLF